MKLQLSTIQIDEKHNLLEITKKIRQLKMQFMKRKCNRIKELYETLSEIVKLKKALDPKFEPRSLEWEEDLKISSWEIRYIFAYKFITPKTMEKINAGLLEDSSVCHFLAQSSLLRQEPWQGLLINKMIKGKIGVGEISELKMDELKLFLEDKLKLRTDDKYFYSMTKSLRTMLVRLKERENLIEKSPYAPHLISAIRNLNKFIGDKNDK